MNKKWTPWYLGIKYGNCILMNWFWTVLHPYCAHCTYLCRNRIVAYTENLSIIQGWAEVSDRFSNRCGLKLVHATPIKFQTLDYQRVLCLFWKFEAFILKQNWFMIKNRIYFLFQKIEFSTLNFFKENQMFFNKKLLNFIQTEIFCVKLSFLNGQQIW